MPNFTLTNPLTALVDLELSAVALCNEGSNSRADILLNKSRKENTSMPKTFEELIKSLDDDAAKMVNTHIAGITKEKDDIIKERDNTIKEKDDIIKEQAEELKKSINKPKVTSEEEVLKTVPPEVAEIFKKQKQLIDSMVARESETLAATRFEKCKALPVEEATLKDVLKTASPAVVDILEKAATAITESMHKATGATTGADFQKQSADAAYAELEKSAKKMQAENEGMTFEKAFMLTCEKEPTLFEKYRNEVR